MKTKKLLQGLKDHMKKLKQDLKPMTFRQKVDHLWTYYKEYALVIAIVLIIIGGVIFSILTPNPNLVSSGTLVNVSLTLEGYDYITDRFYEDVLGSPEGKVALNTATYSSLQSVDAIDDSYQAYMGISAKVEAKELDYLLLDAEAMSYYGNEDMLMDLRKLLPPEELEQLAAEGRLARAEAVTGEILYVAIDLTGMAFAEDCIEDEMPVCLAFIENTPHKDDCLKLWEHIKAWESK